MSEPFIKFFPKDWTADTRLNQCRLASREVWKRMLIIMRDADPFGFFLTHEGHPVDLQWFAREINAPIREVRSCLRDLEEHGVFSRDSQERIYSRRMVREKARREQAHANGLLGGNPALKRVDNSEFDSNPVNPKAATRLSSAIARDRDPEARSQSIDSLRSSALAFGDWPPDNDGLRRLAMIFLGAFGNCFDPVKAEKHLPSYMFVLAQMRGRGVTIEQAWDACQNARNANNDRPLFAASVRAAMSFLPSSGRHFQVAREASETLQSFITELRSQEQPS